MRMRIRVLALVLLTSSVASASPAWAQTPDAIDALLARQAESSDANAREYAPPPAAVSTSPDAICRTMTDLAQRSRRERVCMPRSGWEALIRLAKGSGPHAAAGARLNSGYRGRSER